MQDKVKGEFELFRAWSMNTVYNFYSEGVLKESILRLQSGVEQSVDRRVQVYLALLGSVLLYGLYDSRRQRTPLTVTASGEEDQQVRLRLMQLEIQKLQLEVEVQKLGNRSVDK